ncbi:MAG: radical SAM protein [Chloroflexota bacterium]
MKNKIRVQLVQLNSAYGNQVYIPYTVGMLQAYAEQYDDIQENFEFLPFIYRRDAVESIVDKISDPDILGISCYVWNWQLSIAVAKEVRKRYPSCLIIAGGPHVPDHLNDFFEKYPFIDIACHGEGEITFTEILKTYIDDGPYQDVLGLSYNDRTTNEVTQNPKQARIKDLDTIPSPYLSGTFDPLLNDDSHELNWMVIWETNRGCPFSCSFCDWGSAVAAKVNRFSMDRLYAEIEWFSQNKVTWVFGADANFGIFKRDKELAEKLARMKIDTGFPLEFRVCFTKNSDNKVFDIAKILHDAKMSKGISISMQSLNKDTLENIKRNNIKTDTFHKLQSRYIEEGMATYTELIIGLPGETYSSFKEGLDTLLDNGQHNQITIYNCTVMPNAEMGSVEYQQKYGIKTVEIPIFQAHSAPYEEHDTIPEFEPVVVATQTLPVEEWRRTYHFAWVVQCFHLLGVAQGIAVFLRNFYDINYSSFYEAILAYGKNYPDSLIGQEITLLDDVLDNVLAGIGFDQYLPEFLDITWPTEEASFLRFSNHIEDVYQEIAQIVDDLLKTNSVQFDADLHSELMLYQQSILVNYNRSYDITLDLQFNIPEYIRGYMIDKPVAFEKGKFLYTVIDNKNLDGDKEKFAREVVWYGRKGGKYLYPIEAASKEARYTNAEATMVS